MKKPTVFSQLFYTVMSVNKIMVRILFLSLILLILCNSAYAEKEYLSVEVANQTNAALSKVMHGNFDAAFETLDKLKPRNDAEIGMIASVKGEAYLKMGEPEKAATEFRKTLAYQGWLSRGRIANALHLAGKHEEAYNELETYTNALGKHANNNALKAELCRLKNTSNISDVEKKKIPMIEKQISDTDKELAQK